MRLARLALAFWFGLSVGSATARTFVDEAGSRWRLPKGDPAFDSTGPLGPERVCREVCTERDLLNVHGTFYELPAENAGGFAKLRPVATHNRRVKDFATYRGLLVLSGLSADANNDGRVNLTDRGVWATNYGRTASAFTAAVPEPTSLTLLLIGAFGLKRR